MCHSLLLFLSTFGHLGAPCYLLILDMLIIILLEFSVIITVWEADWYHKEIYFLWP